MIEMATLYHAKLILSMVVLLGAAAAAETELLLGFSVKPSRSSPAAFQPVLTDPYGNFSLGFMPVSDGGLSLVVVHVASSRPLWTASLAHPATWSDRTELSFNGSLVISDSSIGVLWSTAGSAEGGNRAVLLNTSDLQVQKNGPPVAVLWRSFDFPSDTIVENQNFTSNMTLASSNGLYTMRLGDNFIGLYAKFMEGREQMYWMHRAMQVKAAIVEGGGPIYARVESDGYLAMYQNSSKPVDIEAFSSFERPVNSFILLRLEPDGNLKGYYWNGSLWVTDYTAIPDFCELPSACGSYGLCARGNGSCTCLDSRTEPHSGRCEHKSLDLCKAGRYDSGFRVLRMTGVELPYKDQMRYQTASSLEECEGICEGNCSCWGAVYNNASGTGFCYVLDYPIQTLVSVGGDSKAGYFKVREAGHRGKGYQIGYGVGILVWVVIGLVVVGAMVALGLYLRWRKARGVKGHLDLEGEDKKIAPGPYKDLRTASFRSIELTGT